MRIHIADPIYKPECGASPLAPMEFWQRWPGPCGNYFYYDAFGDGAGAQIYLGRTWAICHDPDEGFIAIGSGGPHLTDIVVTGSHITLLIFVLTQCILRWEGPTVRGTAR